MRNDWMIDVLADLQTFARKNGMVQLEQQLELTARMARYEMATKLKDAPIAVRSVGPDAGSVHKPTGASSNA